MLSILAPPPNVTDPLTVKLEPTNNDFVIPTPPAKVTAAADMLVASVVLEKVVAPSVLLDNTCEPANVTTVESIAMVIAVNPLYEVPDKPAPMVNG